MWDNFPDGEGQQIKSNQMRCHQPSLHLGEKLRNLPRDDIVHLLSIVHPRQRLEPLQGTQRTQRQVSWIARPVGRGRIYKQVYRMHKKGKMPQIPQKEFCPLILLTLVANRTTLLTQHTLKMPSAASHRLILRDEQPEGRTWGSDRIGRKTAIWWAVATSDIPPISENVSRSGLQSSMSPEDACEVRSLPWCADGGAMWRW